MFGWPSSALFFWETDFLKVLMVFFGFCDVFSVFFGVVVLSYLLF